MKTKTMFSPSTGSGGSRRGQSTIEYLMNYGWILVVVVVGVIIAWQSLDLKPRYNKKSVTGFSEVIVEDFSFSRSNDNLSLYFINNAPAGDGVQVDDIFVELNVEGAECSGSSQLPLTLEPASDGLILIDCPGFSEDYGTGEYIRARVEITYTNLDSMQSHKSTGMLVGYAEESITETTTSTSTTTTFDPYGVTTTTSTTTTFDPYGVTTTTSTTTTSTTSTTTTIDPYGVTTSTTTTITLLCTAYTPCSDCITNGCLWCEGGAGGSGCDSTCETGALENCMSGTCISDIGDCPAVSCTSYTTCSDCTTNACLWCEGGAGGTGCDSFCGIGLFDNCWSGTCTSEIGSCPG